MQVLFASQNKGKQREAKRLFHDLTVDLVFPEHFSKLKNFTVEEVGTTFKENAILKAKTYAKQLNLSCIADDSGVIIDGLGNNLPGIHSNRWFAGSDDDRNLEVLRRLKDNHDRTARYITVVCFFNPATNQLKTFRGVIEGQINDKIAGKTGFAYDRIFIPQGFEQTFAQLGDEIKNSISQRAQAYSKLKKYLVETL